MDTAVLTPPTLTASLSDHFLTKTLRLPCRTTGHDNAGWQRRAQVQTWELSAFCPTWHGRGNCLVQHGARAYLSPPCLGLPPFPAVALNSTTPLGSSENSTPASRPLTSPPFRGHSSHKAPLAAAPQPSIQPSTKPTNRLPDPHPVRTQVASVRLVSLCLRVVCVTGKKERPRREHSPILRSETNHNQLSTQLKPRSETSVFSNSSINPPS